MNIKQEDVEAGAAFYTKGLLATYDLGVLWLSSRLAWRCPAARIVAHYDRHVSNNHLDVGPGTGYFLDHCRFSSAKPRIALLDLNPNCLDVASRRIARYEPEVHQASVLDPIAIDTAPFDSAALNYVLHCLPGTIRTKSAVFRNLEAVLSLVPAERSATISSLADSDYVAAEVIIEASVERILVPALKRAGASGIITYPLNKVIH